jgi:hypothetical protein
MLEIDDSTEEELTPITSSLLTKESSISEVSRNSVDDPMSGDEIVGTENIDIELRQLSLGIQWNILQ